MFNNNTETKTVTVTPELFNLLTLPYADDADDYTVEDILRLIEAAAKSVGV